MTAPLWGYLVIVKRIFNLIGTAVGTSIVVALLGGCQGADVAVQSTRLPVPVVEPLPISVGIHLSDELRAFAHEEAIRDYGTFRIAVGPAQDLMFNNLAEGLFANHRFLPSTDPLIQYAAAAKEAAETAAAAQAEAEAATEAGEEKSEVSASAANLPAALANFQGSASDLNAVLIPSISELQFSIPAQTKSDFFEVWLNYDFQLLSSEGVSIAEWPMQAYGRANMRNYGFLENTENGALQEAARVALRDAMAVFTFKFKRVPGVQQWLEQQQLVQPNQSDQTPQPIQPIQ